jgi:hypothetical protein
MKSQDLFLRIRALILRKRVEEELNEELRFHLEMAARKNAAAGASGAGAARLARLRFGGLDPLKEECRTQTPAHLTAVHFIGVLWVL